MTFLIIIYITKNIAAETTNQGLYFDEQIYYKSASEEAAKQRAYNKFKFKDFEIQNFKFVEHERNDLFFYN